MLCKEEKTALKVLRQKDVIVGENSSVNHLTVLGDKEDGLLMGKMLREAFLSDDWKMQYISYRSKWLFSKLDEAYDISNPYLIKEVLPLFNEINKDIECDDEDINMYAEELEFLLTDMLALQFGDLTEEYCEKLSKKVSSEDLLYACWNEHPKNDMNKKFLGGSEVYSVPLDLLTTLVNGIQPLTYPYDLMKFRTITGLGGEYLFNNSTYYSITKAHLEKWLSHIESHEENYEAGRWIRFGRYVDVPYAPMGSDSATISN